MSCIILVEPFYRTLHLSCWALGYFFLIFIDSDFKVFFCQLDFLRFALYPRVVLVFSVLLDTHVYIVICALHSLFRLANMSIITFLRRYVKCLKCMIWNSMLLFRCLILCLFLHNNLNVFNLFADVSLQFYMKFISVYAGLTEARQDSMKDYRCIWRLLSTKNT